jgi:Asp-tRNA(Asn)/Glu-tRNA(Gln) amidotransferase C subunit
MAIKSPKEAVYYYEASNGEFRLIYFIPPEELKRLVQNGSIEAAVLEDYPDGVDLNCTKLDFEEFHKLYGYQPENDAEELRRAFFAMFSSTRDWKSFIGAGFIPAADLESLVEPVEDSLQQEELLPEQMEPSVSFSLPDRRAKLARQAAQQEQMVEHLEQMDVKGIDPTLTLREQKFRPIRMQDGKSAEEVFTKLQRKGSGG